MASSPPPIATSLTSSKARIASVPVWLDDSQLNPQWIRLATGLPAVSCTTIDRSNETRKGKSPALGATVQLFVSLMESTSPPPTSRDAQDSDNKAKPSSIRLMIKQVPESGLALSKTLGLGDYDTGHKLILMEDPSDSSVDSGILFGPGNPNNWKRSLPALLQMAFPPHNQQQPPTAQAVAAASFRSIAAVHATFWRRSDLVQYQWLRRAGWLQGKDPDSWEASQKLIRDYWTEYCQTEASPAHTCRAPTLRWDPLVKAAADKAIQGISWEAQFSRLNENGRSTLVHGDFWPGNVLWMLHGDGDSTSQSKPPIRLLDWEMTGLGSGPQDLGQYIFSNMDPSERRVCERELIDIYWKELTRLGVEDVTWQHCWHEYTVSGVERWLWFLVYFCGQDNLLEWAQFFHDQIAAFMHDHSLTTADITQPRP